MIGKVIGAFVGDRLAKQTSSIGGASGAAALLLIVKKSAGSSDKRSH